MIPGDSAPSTLEQDHEALLQFLYMAPVGLAQLSRDGNIVLINPLCAQLLMPLSKQGDLSNLFEVLKPVAPDLAHRARIFAPLHGKVCDAMHIQTHGGTSSHDAQILSLTLLKLDADRLMAVLDDVTQSVKRDRELRHSQSWIHSISSGIFDVSYALMSLDDQGIVQGWNVGIRNLTGFEAEATIGRSYANFYPEGGMLGHRALERLREADQTGWNLEEGWLRRSNGERYWGSCLIAPVETVTAVSGTKCTYSLVIRDISDRRESDEALRRSVWSDHLTGLANRRAFFDAASTAAQRRTRTGEPITIVLFDADHFKAVNDTHGHAAGDAVLRHLAAGLSVTFTPTDVVARFGGEEFVVLLTGNSLAEAKATADRFRSHIAASPVTVDGVQVLCTVSAGVATSTDGACGIDELLRKADIALYAAKAAGRDRVAVWDDALEQQGRASVGGVLP
ncbi:sensor domain-containing diguanylate cyclase [Variovorax sp. N23]|uniref:sensor domain-containing diguanylate cyclase n=1 Tax=Variovorax sp. N23 TaxID=2980555 RepID=UPI0021C7B671|nr:sensor domain-containing diguanylate cyclase [Variovorax sp. N23]MCU4121055.1 sensor domain-containing diguanylate cyclase [Variovorax sp. N23]